MSEKEGFIEVTVHRDAQGGVERYEYEWIGGDIARISETFIAEGYPDVVSLVDSAKGHYPLQAGDRIKLGPFSLRVIKHGHGWRYDCITVIRDRGLVTDLRYLWYRFGKLLDIAYRRLILTLVVWRLAEWREGVIPTWQDIKVLRRLADWERGKKEKRIKKMIDEINRKLAEEADR